MDIVWENPPPRAVGRQVNPKEAAFADALKQRPAAWARFKELPAGSKKAGTLAQTIREGKRAAFRTDTGRFEASQRTVDNKLVLYVRYLEN